MSYLELRLNRDRDQWMRRKYLRDGFAGQAFRVPHWSRPFILIFKNYRAEVFEVRPDDSVTFMVSLPAFNLADAVKAAIRTFPTAEELAA